MISRCRNRASNVNTGYYKVALNQQNYVWWDSPLVTIAATLLNLALDEFHVAETDVRLRISVCVKCSHMCMWQIFKHEHPHLRDRAPPSSALKVSFASMPRYHVFLLVPSECLIRSFLHPSLFPSLLLCSLLLSFSLSLLLSFSLLLSPSLSFSLLLYFTPSVRLSFSLSLLLFVSSSPSLSLLLPSHF